MDRKPDPPPLETDDVRTVGVGTALWAVALVASLVLGESEAAWTCAAGLGLGGIGLTYVRRRASHLGRSRGES